MLEKHLKASRIQCRDRALQTSEWHQSNDFYGHATILKQAMQLPQEIALKAPVEHSLFCQGFAWDIDYQAPYPSLLTMGSYRFETLRQFTGKLLFSVGPIIQYAPLLGSQEERAATKARLGRTLLVFMPKSSHRIEIELDMQYVLGEVSAVSQNFDTILFCFGWKDVLLNRHKRFQDHGICVSAGHMFDHQFLCRLKTIYEISDVSMSFVRGTHIPYSILLDTPHFLRYRKWGVTGSEQAQDKDLLKTNQIIDIITAEHKKLFGEFSFKITEEQRDYMHKMASIKEKRTIQQLLGIFLIVEEAYKLSNETKQSGISLGLKLLDKYQKENKPVLETLLLQALQTSDANSPELVANQGRQAVRRGDKLAAVRAARWLIKHDIAWKKEADAILSDIR